MPNTNYGQKVNYDVVYFLDALLLRRKRESTRSPKLKLSEIKPEFNSGVEALREALPTLAKGQMEIYSKPARLAYCGQLKSLTIDDGGDTFAAKFTWVAERNTDPPAAWKSSDLPLKGGNFEWDLDSCLVVNIGPGPDGGGDRWLLTFFNTQEIVLIHPPDGDKLDPALVEGLNFDSP